MKFDGRQVPDFVGNMRYLPCKSIVTWALT